MVCFGGMNKISSIDDLEVYLDQLFYGLRVYRWPIDVTLWHAFSITEMNVEVSPARSGPPYMYSVDPLLEKRALELLVPELYKRCPEPPPVPPTGESVTEIANDVTQALEFCRRYHKVCLAYTQHRQFRFTAGLSGRIATFLYPGTETARFANLDWVLKEKLQNKVDSDAWDMGGPQLVGSVRREVSSAISSVGRADLDSLSTKMYSAVRTLIEALSLKPSLPIDTLCGTYTLGDAYDVWMELKSLVWIHELSTQELTKVSLKKAYDARILRLNLLELAESFAARIEVPETTIRNVLADLEFDPSVRRPDVLIRPLCPIPCTDDVFCAPFMIDSARWETCLLRNLATMSPKVYGKTIAPKKVSPLSDELAQMLKNKGFLAASRREVTDASGQSAGDVDIAVLDVAGKRLDLVEVKWLITPDSPHEDFQANGEIEYGRQQLRRLLSVFAKDPSAFVRQLFSDLDSINALELQLGAYVLSKGFIGFKPLTEKPFVLDYDEVVETINSGAGTLRDIWEKSVEAHKKMALPPGAFSSQEVIIGGYLLRVPIFAIGVFPGDEIQPPPKRGKVGRNSPCLCGSGHKFKKCCIDLY